jgi:uncharacterized membrane protein YphA (DoxX/SURF4 family)
MSRNVRTGDAETPTSTQLDCRVAPNGLWSDVEGGAIMASSTVQTRRGSATGAAANGVASVDRARDVSAAAHQAFWLLRIAFTVAPILFGIDKFFNWSVQWPDYLAGWVNDIVPGSGQDWMYVVGGIEIAAGLLVAFAPRIGAFVVAGWLFGIVVNLLTKNAPEYYDIALRDFGLMLAALTFGRLALAVVPARKSGALPARPW